MVRNPTHITMFLLPCLLVLRSCLAWDFHDVVPQDAPVVSVAVLDSRAFLAVPRVWRDPRDALDGHPVVQPQNTLMFLHDGPTLLVAPWPEPDGGDARPANSTTADILARIMARSRTVPRVRKTAPPRAFPKPEEQVLGDPNSLQSATAVAVEGCRGAARLWVLDSGEVPSGSHTSVRCPPKVVVFNLRGNNQKVWQRPLDGVEASAVSGLAVDPTTQDTRAYVGYPGAPGGSAILVFSWKNKAFWQLRLNGMEAAPQLRPQPAPQRARAFRRRHPRQAPVQPTPGPNPTWDLALVKSSARRPRMVLAPRDSPYIFDVSLDALRGIAPDANHRNDALVPAAELGARRLVRKPEPGPSSGLLGDSAGGLVYFRVGPTGGSVVRWDPRSGAGSCGHAVVYQDNATLPLASAIFLDGQGSAWAACTTFASHHHGQQDYWHQDGQQDYWQQDGQQQDYPDPAEPEEPQEPREAEYFEEDYHHDELDADEDNYYGDSQVDVLEDLPTTTSTPRPPRHRSNRCRFPHRIRSRRAVKATKWGTAKGDGRRDAGAMQDSAAGHAAEPQEYVCMSPSAPVGVARTPSCRTPAQRGAQPAPGPKTMMVTRRTERKQNRESHHGDVGTHPHPHGNMLVHHEPPTRSSTSTGASLHPLHTVHCVKLQWPEARHDG